MLQHHQRYHLVWQWQISVSSWLSVKPNRGSLTSSRFAASPQAWVTDLRESTIFLASLNGGSNPSIVKSVIQAKNWGSNPEGRNSSPDIGAVTHFHQLFFAYAHGYLQGLAEYQYPVATGPTVWRENLILKLPTSVKVVCSYVPIGGWG